MKKLAVIALIALAATSCGKTPGDHQVLRNGVQLVQLTANVYRFCDEETGNLVYAAMYGGLDVVEGGCK